MLVGDFVGEENRGMNQEEIKEVVQEDVSMSDEGKVGRGGTANKKRRKAKEVAMEPSDFRVTEVTSFFLNMRVTSNALERLL